MHTEPKGAECRDAGGPLTAPREANSRIWGLCRLALGEWQYKWLLRDPVGAAGPNVFEAASVFTAVR